MRRPGTVAAVFVFAAMAAVGTYAVIPRPRTPPVAHTLGVADPITLPPPRIEVRPSLERAPTPAESLEMRLAALARAVESRRIGSADASLARFDVEGLAAEINAIIARYASKVHVSVHVRDLESQHVLFDYFGDMPLIPASNQKLVTAAAALDLLGPDYTFRTIVAADDRMLYLRGEGDPSLQVDDLDQIATLTLGQIDIGAFERLVVDDTVFSPRFFAPDYPEGGPGYSYEAPSGALSTNFNTIEVTVFPVAAARGATTIGVTVVPNGSAVVVENRARVGRRRAIGIATRSDDEGHTVVRVEGTLTKSSRPVVERRRVADPGLFTGSVFAEILAEQSATRPLPVERGRLPAEADVLVDNASTTLLEVLDAGLAYSNNFIAEQVLRTLAWRMTGDPGDWNAGQQVLHDYWAALIGDPEQLTVVNAAGLTRQGRATTSGLVDLITVAHRTAADRDAGLLDALPVAGEEGTLRTRLRLSGRRVRAKTGTLTGVSGLTGVITAEDGTPQVGFSILVNAHEGVSFDAKKRRQIEDRIVMDVLGALDAYEALRTGLLVPKPN
jgi:D-alanyl-D-alanine carboxypeptidase/D-alanyl-D-alanine-endopeptidase (penicillin-binding protein 4)